MGDRVPLGVTMVPPEQCGHVLGQRTRDLPRSQHETQRAQYLLSVVEGNVVERPADLVDRQLRHRCRQWVTAGAQHSGESLKSDIHSFVLT
jgi:hypothetical protein